MRINVYGCSWSAGVPEVDDHISWPAMLAKMFPEENIFNYALGGSSIQWSFKNLLDTQATGDITVFQCTSPTRWTYQSDPLLDLDKIMETKHYNNHKSIVHTVREYVETYQVKKVGRMLRFSKDRENFYKDYLRYYDIDNYSCNEWATTVHAAKSIADFTYVYRLQDYEYYKKVFGEEIFCLEKEIKNMRDYEVDNGFHLGKEGCEIMAKEIFSRLNIYE